MKYFVIVRMIMDNVVIQCYKWIGVLQIQYFWLVIFLRCIEIFELLLLYLNFDQFFFMIINNMGGVGQVGIEVVQSM